MVKKQRRDKYLLVRLSGAERRALNKTAAAQDVPASQIIRKAIRQAISEAETLRHASKSV